MDPIEIRFDGEPNVNGSSVVHFPPILQGVPNQYSLKLKDSNGVYFDWTQYTEILMRPRWTQGKATGVFTLTKTDGDFITTADTLTILVKPEKTAGMVGFTYPSSTIVGAALFVFDIKAYTGMDVPAFRVAQGTGLISLDTSRDLS